MIRRIKRIKNPVKRHLKLKSPKKRRLEKKKQLLDKKVEVKFNQSMTTNDS
jgi:hypothetical protein